MRVVFFGAGGFAVPTLRWLINSPHELAGVVTQPDRPAGRGKHLTPTPVAERAALEGLEAVRCADVNAPAFVEQMQRLAADIGVVVDFGQKLGDDLRAAFRGECINIHGSLLPRHRGAAPVVHAILSGDRETGVTVFRMVDRMDAGRILVQRRTMIGPHETAEELEGRLAGIGCDALDAALKLHESDPLPAGVDQDESQATRAPKLVKADGLLRFDRPAELIARRCRAMWPWPGGRCRYIAADSKAVDATLAVVTAVPGAADGVPGEVTTLLTVATLEGTLEIHSLKPAGSRMMSWHDFVNGRRVQPGDRFVSLES